MSTESCTLCATISTRMAEDTWASSTWRSNCSLKNSASPMPTKASSVTLYSANTREASDLGNSRLSTYKPCFRERSTALSDIYLRLAGAVW